MNTFRALLFILSVFNIFRLDQLTIYAEIILVSILILLTFTKSNFILRDKKQIYIIYYLIFIFIYTQNYTISDFTTQYNYVIAYLLFNCLFYVPKKDLERLLMIFCALFPFYLLYCLSYYGYSKHDWGKYGYNANQFFNIIALGCVILLLYKINYKIVLWIVVPSLIVSSIVYTRQNTIVFLVLLIYLTRVTKWHYKLILLGIYISILFTYNYEVSLILNYLNKAYDSIVNYGYLTRYIWINESLNLSDFFEPYNNNVYVVDNTYISLICTYGFLSIPIIFTIIYNLVKLAIHDKYLFIVVFLLLLVQDLHYLQQFWLILLFKPNFKK